MVSVSTEQPRSHRVRRGRAWRRVVPAVLGGGLLLVLLAVLIAYWRTEVPEPDDLAVAGATRVLYSDGSELGRVGGQNRIPVTLDKVPTDAREAMLAAEDRGFYTEPGISPRGILRALFTNVRGGGEIQQGGSTITQQYAKNAFLSDGGTAARTYTRKVQEIFIALKMTREVPKEQILEDYLNTIYFGRGAYGIQVAANTYFGKPVEQLTTEEAAVLAATVRSPANYDPEADPERARERWDYVLDGMVEEGWLDAGARAAMQYPAVQPASAANKNNDLSGPKGHVIQAVMAELERELDERDQSELLQRGLEVTTTIRRPAQDAAVAAVQEVVGASEEEGALKGALVSIEPTSGAVVAYYGGATGTGFDYAAQGNGRQPGSSFKPYTLAAALEEGISLRSTYDGNSPKRFPGLTRPVENFGGDDYGRVSLLEATENSVNTAYFELGIDVGPAKVAELAHRAGITTPLGEPQPEAGISLGIYDVRVIDQASGYATFANEGVRVAPHMIDRVRQGDEDLFQVAPQAERAMEEDVAADVTSALQRVVTSGTGTRARLGSRPVAGKTGTTSDNYDAWFAGYTPQLSTVVWIGTGRNETIEIPGLRQATGGTVSAGIWRDYMAVAMDGMPVERFPRAANVGRAKGGSSSSSDDDEQTTRPRTSRPRTRAPQTQEPVETDAPAPQQTSAPQQTAQPQEPVETQPEAPTQPTVPGGGGGGGGGSTGSPPPGTAGSG
jgi:membrane peptidoglycan carboxypeptidase